MPKVIHYHIYTTSEQVYISRKVGLYPLGIKEHIKGSLFCAISAHLLQVASESAPSPYEIERTLCTQSSSSLRHASIIPLRDGGTTLGSSSLDVTAYRLPPLVLLEFS